MTTRFTKKDLGEIKEALEWSIYHINKVPDHPCRELSLKPVQEALAKVKARLKNK